MTTQPSLLIEELAFAYPDGNQALFGVNLRVERGERVALLGPNGAGKTTLVMHMNGIHPAEHGRVSVAGEVIDTTPSLYLQKNGSIHFWNGHESKHPTPKIRGYSIPRGCEIEYWLKDKGFSHINWSKVEQEEWISRSGIENYVIIDDDSDMLYGQRNNFVHVYPSPRNTKGFAQSHYEKAKEILLQTVADITYGK